MRVVFGVAYSARMVMVLRSSAAKQWIVTTCSNDKDH